MILCVDGFSDSMGDEFHIRGILMRATGYLKSEIIMS
jgi:hypothetical protein